MTTNRTPKISKEELGTRLKGIAEYNAYQLKEGQEHNCLTQRALDRQMEAWGYDPALAADVGHQPQPSTRIP